jgi:transcription termination/antitermination protein NusG
MAKIAKEKKVEVEVKEKAVRKSKKVRVSAADLLNPIKKPARKNSKQEVEEVINGSDNSADMRKFSKEVKWYVLSVQSGHENSVQRAIKQRIDATGITEMIGEVLVPTQKKIIVKGGKQIIRDEKLYPGYVMINMALNEKTWEIISSTEGVKGFVRTDRYPRPLPENQIKAIMKYMEVQQPEFQASFSVGDAVKVTDGAFADFIGSVQEIDEAKGKAKVLISFLGREAPVELEFNQITKL